MNKENKPNCIISLLYKNLRADYERLIEEILGADYYNMGMDVYTTDDLACTHMIREYRRLKKQLEKWQVFGVTLSIAGVIFFITLAITL